jgi:hypothetical protein
MAAKKWRMLKAGEVVLPTDQVYVGAPVNKWLCGSLNCGKKLPMQYEGGYRRLDTNEAGRTVRPKRAVQQLKQAIVFLNRALMCGGSTRSWMEDVTTFVREVEKQRHCV